MHHPIALMGERVPTLSACARTARDYDHDRYLSALFAPAERREALFALYAFNAEVARTREVVSEALLGHIRLQWWREALDGIAVGEVRAHPVVEALAAAMARFDLDRTQFDRLLDARAADLDDAPPATLAALQDYADATSGALAVLAMAVLGFTEDAPMRAARQVGTAWGLIGLVRAVPFHARAQRLYLPDELLREHGVDRRALFALTPSPALSEVVRAITAQADGLLAEARALKAEVPRAARRGLLLGSLARRYRADIARAGYDPFALPPVSSPARPLRLAWAALRGAY